MAKPKVQAEARTNARPRVKDAAGDEFGAAEMARQVAEHLRKLRREKDLSLDDLAARSGVSRAALSQIEGARTNPTLAVLWKIAVGLDVPFHELLGTPEREGVRILRAGDTPPLKTGDGRMESRLLSPGGSATNVEIYDLRFLPKALHKSDAHGAGTTETLLLLTGSVRVALENQSYELSVGDSMFFRADVPHSYENRSTRETRCLNIIHYPRP